MKKAIALLFTLAALTLALTACNSGPTTTTIRATEAPVQATGTPEATSQPEGAAEATAEAPAEGQAN